MKNINIVNGPQNVSVIVQGCMRMPDHIKDICEAAKIELSHHDWYELYLAAGKFLP